MGKAWAALCIELGGRERQVYSSRGQEDLDWEDPQGRWENSDIVLASQERILSKAK